MFGMDVTFPQNKGDKIWFYNKDEADAAATSKLIIDGNGVAAEVIEQVGMLTSTSLTFHHSFYPPYTGHRSHQWHHSCH